MCGISLLGKSFIMFYRAVKTGSFARPASTALAYAYKGGFERAMTEREAALILGIT